MKRNLILSPAFKEFEQSANPRTREKLRYAISILETVCPVPVKFVKKLVGTDFFELRVSVDNEIRVYPICRGQRQHQSGDKRYPAERLCKEKHQGLRQGNNKGY